MTTANKLTILRVILIPAFMGVLLIGTAAAKYAALAIFIIASLTDFADGYIARHYNQVSTFGKFMDPLADKLLVVAALMIFTEWGQIPSWCTMLILAREFAVTGLRLVAVEAGVVIAAAWSGKIKTASSMVAICIMLTPLAGISLIGFVTINTLCVAVMVIATVWSGVEYFVKNAGAFKPRRD